MSGGTNCKHVFTRPYNSPAQMSSPTRSAPTAIDVPNVPEMPVDAGPDPATPLRMVGSITYDREENGYNLEWERANFGRWLTHEKMAIGIEIQTAKTPTSKAGQQVYLTCETFRCACNGC
jgi:hypothetical protein